MVAAQSRPANSNRSSDGATELPPSPTEQEEDMLSHAPGTHRLDRRSFLVASAAAAAMLAAPRVLRAAQPFELPPLPYAENALDPVITTRTMSFHYGKHHRAYVENLNKLLADAPDLADLKLKELIRTSAGNPDRTGIFNNAAQAWNHTFYWHSMRPGGGGQPAGALKDKIDADLGGVPKFREAFAKAATTQFGSGWAWLVQDASGKIAVIKTDNAMNPMVAGSKPLLTIDVWEHAYYLDYQNRRADYVQAWLDKLANWDFAAENIG
jgi:Fe-Mn family superoxide dismutase